MTSRFQKVCFPTSTSSQSSVWRLAPADKVDTTAATVSKIISEILANDAGVTFSKESRDLLIECCVEFITLISSEANDIAEKEAKKTIACEHVQAALEQLGYPDYVPEILKVAQEHKAQQAVRTRAMWYPAERLTTCQSREKKQSKIEQSGLSEEELIRQQQELFRSATDKFMAAPHADES